MGAELSVTAMRSQTEADPQGLVQLRQTEKGLFDKPENRRSHTPHSEMRNEPG